MRNITHFICLSLLLGLLSCGLFLSRIEGAQVEVRHRGALRAIMHEGDLQPKAELKDFAETAHVYALGAVADLKGEILILDSWPVISSVEAGELVLSPEWDHSATLLVWAQVPNWGELRVPGKVQSYEELEAFVEESAEEAGIDTEQPFPFLLKGEFAAFDWHVIDWPEGDTEHSHEKHVNSGLHGRETNREGTILGFYSKHHHAIFTHHTTNMHLHIQTTDGEVAGHVDGLTLGRGMRLSLPGN